MRVCIFSEYYAPNLGGVQSRMQGLAEAFCRMGHDVSVVTSGYERGLPSRELINGVEIRRIDIPGYGMPRWKFLRRDLGGMLRYALACRRIASREEFDLFIYGEFPLLHSVIAPAAARRRALLDWCEFRRNAIFGALQRWLPPRFRWNMAVSAHVAELVRDASGSQILCMPSGIDAASFRGQPSEARSGLLYVGRLFEHKNIPLAIQGFERLCESGYPGDFTIAGDGPLRADITAQRDASPWAGRIVILGEVDDAQKADLMSRAQILVLLSRREGFPVVVAEAMASGLPCVTAQFVENGTVAVVEEYACGKVVEPTPAGFVQGAQAVLDRWEDVAATCRAQSRRLDWNTVAPALLRQLGFQAR
jgi:glycosyltransferase involved in cell wall biosynthesis